MVGRNETDWSTFLVGLPGSCSTYVDDILNISKTSTRLQKTLQTLERFRTT